jgi:hypothetical protein
LRSSASREAQAARRKAPASEAASISVKKLPKVSMGVKIVQKRLQKLQLASKSFNLFPGLETYQLLTGESAQKNFDGSSRRTNPAEEQV